MNQSLCDKVALEKKMGLAYPFIKACLGKGGRAKKQQAVQCTGMLYLGTRNLCNALCGRLQVQVAIYT